MSNPILNLILGIEEPEAKVPTKFRYMNKEYNYKSNVLGLKNRVIKRDSRQVKDLIKLGYHIDESGAIPKIKAGEIIREKKYVQNPLNKKRMEYQGRQFNNFIKNGWKFDANLEKLLAPSLGEVIPIWGVDNQLNHFYGSTKYPDGYYAFIGGEFVEKEPPNNKVMKHTLTAMLNEYTAGMKSAYIVAMHDDGAGNYRKGDVKKIKDMKDILHGALAALYDFVGGGYLTHFSMEDYIRMMEKGVNPFGTIFHNAPEVVGYADNLENIYQGEDELIPKYFGLIVSGEVQPLEFLALNDDNGVEAGFCVKHAFEEQFPEENWEDIPDCCGEEDMVDIAYSYRRDIRVYTVNDFNKPLYIFKPKDNTACPHINLLYQFNHVLLLPQAQLGCALKWANDESEIEFYDDKGLLINKFIEISQAQPVKPMITFNGKTPELNGFTTCDLNGMKGKHYKQKFLGYDIQPTAWTTTGASLKHFRKMNGEPLQQKRLRKLRMDDKITIEGITYNDYESHPNAKQLYLYDQSRAYASYDKCPFYTGFPDPSGVFEVFEWDDELLTADVEGVAYVHTKERYPKTIFERSSTWATLPQIRYAKSRGEILTIHFIVLTTRVEDPYKDCKEKFGTSKMWFNKLVGRQFMHQTFPISLATSPDEVAALERGGQGVIGKPFSVDDTKTIWMCGGDRSEPKDPEYPFVSAYVHAYQKITMHHDLISKIPWKNIVSIWVDGVKVIKPLEFELPADRWKPVEIIHVNKLSFGQKKACDVWSGAMPQWREQKPVKFDNALIHKRIALLAPPGCGKTYTIQQWIKDGKNFVLSASTHLASMNLTSEDGVQPSTTQKLLTIAQKTPHTFRAEHLSGADRLVVDEFTMLSRSELNKLLELNIPLVLCGDFEQLCNPLDENPVDMQWLNDNGFLIKELTEIKRASSEETKELYTACRGKTTQQMLSECEKMNIPKRSFTVEDFPSPNERRHYIASKNDAIDKVNEDYANYLYDNHESERLEYEINNCKSIKGMLVIGVDTSTHFRNQEVGYLEGFELIKKKVYALVYSLITNKVVRVPINNLAVGFAITFHRCQGQTFNFPIYVDVHRLFLKAMLYVAITRVPDIKYLTLLEKGRGIFLDEKKQATPKE
jgi:hypothetical protein